MQRQVFGFTCVFSSCSAFRFFVSSFYVFATDWSPPPRAVFLYRLKKNKYHSLAPLTSSLCRVIFKYFCLLSFFLEKEWALLLFKNEQKIISCSKQDATMLLEQHCYWLLTTLTMLLATGNNMLPHNIATLLLSHSWPFRWGRGYFLVRILHQYHLVYQLEQHICTLKVS